MMIEDGRIGSGCPSLLMEGILECKALQTTVAMHEKAVAFAESEYVRQEGLCSTRSEVEQLRVLIPIKSQCVAASAAYLEVLNAVISSLQSMLLKINNSSVDYEGINEQKSAITSYCDHAYASKALMMEKARQFQSSLELLYEGLGSLYEGHLTLI